MENINENQSSYIPKGELEKLANQLINKNLEAFIGLANIHSKEFINFKTQ